MNTSNIDISSPVDWSCFNIPLPPGTSVNPQVVEMKRIIKEQIAENRLKEKKIKG